MLIRVPDPQSDWVFSSEDFAAGELVTHAQSCIWLLGHSDLGNALLRGVDPHSDLAAAVVGVSYDEFIHGMKKLKIRAYKDGRQASKPFNFGRPAGMGAPKIAITQRKQGPDTPCENGPSWIEVDNQLVRGYKGLRFCILMDGADRCGEFADGRPNKARTWGKYDQQIKPTCRHCLECADRLNGVWLRKWSENQPYFDFVGDCVDSGMLITEAALARWPHLRDNYSPLQRLAPGEIMQHVTGRIRGGVEFSQAANGFFQALLADIAKHAHRIVSRECYDNTIRVPDMLFDNSLRSEYAGMLSPLYGSRIPVFQHDEVIGEHPRSVASDAAIRISEIMRDVMRFYCRDVADAANAEPTLMPRWIKGAEAVWRIGKLDIDSGKRDTNKRATDCKDNLEVWEPKIKMAA